MVKTNHCHIGIVFILTIFALLSCDDNSHNYQHQVNVERVVVEKPTVDTAQVKVETVIPRAMFKPSAPAPKTTPSTSAYYDETDNLRGFDPIFEDDKEDNGMRRNMENDDEDGWD